MGAQEQTGSELLRRELTPEQRAAPMRLAIDPGFVNHRLIETVLGSRGTSAINQQIASLPLDMPEWLRTTQLGHIYTRTMVAFCEINKMPTLSEMLHERSGSLFCSTECLAPAPEVYDRPRAVSRIVKPAIADLTVELHYTTERIISDTVRHRLYEGADLSVIALRRSEPTDGTVVFEPLIIGSPWLSNDGDDVVLDDAEWWSYSFGEVFAEDIDELSRVSEVEMPDDAEPMRAISKKAFKQCLAELLGEVAPKDWGGEQSDLFSARVHLRRRRTTAAFLLKGPARFTPMTLAHLGKNGDQIYRLAQEPADLLVVQHCHDITPPVRATLRQFAIAPGRLRRRYCLIDGRDSLRILKAYDKLTHALELSAS